MTDGLESGQRVATTGAFELFKLDAEVLEKTKVQIAAGRKKRKSRRSRDAGRERPGRENPEHYWFARHSKSIIFLICMLTVVGVYEALTLPVAVFPTTNFPRIIIGVDNGVMPIEQMEVTITRPIEEAVRIVPGLEDVRSITSRGSAEIDLFFDWNVNMLETLQLVDAAVSRVQSSLPPTAQIQTHRLDFASFPIIGYSLTSDKVPQTDLWELATYEIKPRLNRLPGVASVLVQGGQRPEFHVTVDPARMLRAKTSIADILGAVNRTNVIDSPGLLNRNHQLFLGLVTGRRTARRDRQHRHQAREQRAGARAATSARVGAGRRARVHGGQRQREAGACCSASTVSRTATRCRWPTKCTRRWRHPADAAGRRRRCGRSTISRTSSTNRSRAFATRSSSGCSSPV